MKAAFGIARGETSGVTCRPGHNGPTSPRPACRCCIVPTDVLERFAHDKKLSAEERKAFADTATFEKEWRKARVALAKMSQVAQAVLPSGLRAEAAAAPPRRHDLRLRQR